MKQNYFYNAVLTNVVDGDTIDVTVDLGFNIFSKMRLRLYGIDTMEKNDPDPTKRELAKKSEDYLKQFLLQPVFLETFKPDKYGRYLANVYCNNVFLNGVMLRENLAVPYFGGKKT